VGGYSPNDLLRTSPGTTLSSHRPGKLGINLLKAYDPRSVPGDTLIDKAKETLFGVRGLTEESAKLGHSTSPLVRGGEKLAGYSEAVMRNSTFIAQLRKGVPVDQAAAISKAAHVDYSKMTPFTARYMRRIFPFWQFQSNMLRFQAGMLAENPASFPRQAMRVQNALLPEDTFVPEYVAAATSIPKGSEYLDSNGVRRQSFMSFDLPHEAVFNTAFRPGMDSMDTLRGTMGGWMGMTNPLIKGAAEIASGKQFFTGRDMDELDSGLGRIAQALTGAEQPPNVPRIADQLVGMSPASRYAYSLGQVLQPYDIKGPGEKAANLLSGIRITNVNMDAARRAAEREYATRMFANHPGVYHYSTLAVKPDAYANMSPAEQQLARMLRSQRAGTR